MEYADYHVVYVDNRVSQDLNGRLLQNSEPNQSNIRREITWEEQNPALVTTIGRELAEVRSNLRSLLSVFNGVHTCTTGHTCMERIVRLDSLSGNIQPVLVMLGTPAEDAIEARPSEIPSRNSTENYGLALIQQISTRICESSLSKLVVPLAMIYDTEPEPATDHQVYNNHTSSTSSGGFPRFGTKSTSTVRMISGRDSAWTQWAKKCLDNGAVDVLISPLQDDRLRNTTVLAYRAHKEASRELAKFHEQRSRKRSWLGANSDKKYAYLREAMVSELMRSICNPDEYQQTIDPAELPGLSRSKEAELTGAIGSWAFSGHDFSEEELIHAACLMLQHALRLPELEKWRLSTADLKVFLLASRKAYNSFVNYHNFRHVIDVMQAIFYFLVRLGTLPPYPASAAPRSEHQEASPIAALLKPFDALTLLITAIGHDVGHPGVNNAFLVALNAPLAQLYNDKSVLEAFHCAAYSQILRRHWKAVFEDTQMRSLMINSILATDMGMHFHYMKELSNLQEKVHHNGGTDGWSPQILDEYRILTCALMVKCADISNVARPFDVATKWANILQLEFANQGVMENDVGIQTTLFGGPPELGNLIKLGNSQNNFMNIFARPLFEGVTDILPAMMFAVDEMKMNQETWTKRIKLETAKDDMRGLKRDPSDVLLSPRSGSPDRSFSQPELSHPEGLPASHPMESSPLAQAMQASDESRRASVSSIPLHLTAPDGNPQHNDKSRRSSLGHPLSRVDSIPDSASFSRRSSGGSPATSIPQTTRTTRKLSNSSPSQLQLGSSPDPRSQTTSPGTISENIQPYRRISEDTLSQPPLTGTALSADGSRRSSATSGLGGNVLRRASKVNDQDNIPVNHSSTNGTLGRPIRLAHHRSSSGAHTNNTSGSQGTPYSPTETQATSVLTVDSDDESSQGRIDSLNSTDRKGMPAVVNMDRPGSVHHSGSASELEPAKDAVIRTSVMGNGALQEVNGHHRAIGRKSSRFNFNFWKKKKGHETSP